MFTQGWLREKRPVGCCLIKITRLDLAQLDLDCLDQRASLWCAET